MSEVLFAPHIQCAHPKTILFASFLSNSFFSLHFFSLNICDKIITVLPIARDRPGSDTSLDSRGKGVKMVICLFSYQACCTVIHSALHFQIFGYFSLFMAENKHNLYFSLVSSLISNKKIKTTVKY